ncbi:kelch-like protein 10 [Genypterus blacodes]|uniref:kelch-like protein 10 n=1 Tax=Genypterus blacodes TaxID=154954 RepID=UPI003F772420
MSQTNTSVQDKGSNPSLDELRLRKQLCDAVISVQGQEFPIHKSVLSHYSQYFRACFSWNLHKKVYKLDEFTPEIIRLVIDFAYIGNVEVTKENAQSLYMASEYFVFPSLKEACSTFMEQQLCVENCIQTWQFTAFSSCPRLNHAAYLFIALHFTEVCTTPEFLELSVEELSGLIEEDKLNVKEEGTVFEAVLRWIDHSAQERSRHLSLLLPKIRLGLMSSDYFTNNVKNNDLVMWNKDLEETIRMTQTLINERIIFSNGINHPLARPRLPVRILLAVGGCEDVGLSDEIQAFDTCTDQWVTVAENEAARLGFHGSVFLNGSVYCVGGSDGDDVIKGVCRFDLDSGTWHWVMSMWACRCFVSVTVLNGRIFAIGGFDGHHRLSSVECYDPETNKWAKIAAMQEKRSDADCTTLEGKVYVCGGFDGSHRLCSAECYSPETNQWTLIAPMSSRRSGLGVITYEGCVCAVGGNNGVTLMNSAEAYDPWTESWHEVPSMQVCRSNFGIEVVNDSIFVIGGFSNGAYLSNVEFYNLSTGVWSKATDMTAPRGALGCCVVHGLNNMADYAAPRHSLPLSSLDTNAQL